MFVRRIKLRNFKSFKRAEIVFKDNFTVITGPNGSGKSNVIDSILFCFGLTSSKTLRAEKLTDLIRHGQKEGEVEIELEGYTIRRKVKETDRGYYSYYYINGRNVGYSDVERLVERLGLNTEYSVVMQGDVTRIAEMTPIQRRKIMEDVAGISEFEEKKERALEELEDVKNNIEKVEITLREVVDRLSKLKVEREEALRYKGLLREREELESFTKAHDYIKLSKELEKLREKFERLNFERDEILKGISRINSEIAKLNEEMEEIVSRIGSFKDRELKKINEEINRTMGEINGCRKLIDLYTSEIEELREERGKLILSIEKARGEVEGIERELNEMNLKIESLEKIAEEKNDILNSLKLRYEEIYSKYGIERRKLESKLEVLDELKEKRTALLKEREKVLEGLRRVEMEIEEIEVGKDSIDLKGIIDEIVEDEKRLAILRNEVEKLKMRLFEIDGDVFKIRDEISKIDRVLREKEIELAKSSAVRPKAVDIVLKARDEGRLRGIYGTVSQLCRVDEMYSLALEVAGGNALNFLVVENEDCAIEAVKYLKEVGGGRASFIPLNRINVHVNYDPSVLRFEGVVDYAVNLIECDEKFRKVFELVYRDTLVVEDIDTAKKFINRLRVVTLEGDLIEKSGVITGGQVRRRSMGLFSEGLREEIEGLKRKRGELELELSKAEEERKALQIKLERLNAEMTEIKVRLSTNRGRLEEFKRILGDAERRLKEKREEAEKLNLRATELESELSKVEGEIRVLEDDLKRVESKLRDYELSKLNEEIEKVRRELERIKDLKSVINSKISGLKAKRDELLKSLEEYESNLRVLEGKISERSEKVEETRRKVKELERNLKDLKEREREISGEVGDLRRRRDEILSKINELEREKADKVLMERILREKIEGLKEKIDEFSSKLEGYDVEIPEDLPPLEYVKRRLEYVERELKGFGDVNMKAIQEFEEVKERYESLKEKKEVLERERSKIVEKIREIERLKREAFMNTFKAVNEKFKEIVRELADGEGEIYLDKEDPFQSGLHIRFKPFGKPIQRLEAMSGGEKSLLTLAFIFAIQRFKPAPFYAFDEVDMFLDGVNVGRLAKMIKRLSKNAQFIVVSLRKPMIENADHVVGITRGGDGESIVTAIQLK